jgi:hypothetical protein
VQEYDTIPIEVEGYLLPVPWKGGYNDTAPDFIDIDGDGDYDIVLGSSYYQPPELWQNTGTIYEENLVHIQNGLPNIQDEGHTRPELWDMENDGDYDLFLSSCSDPIISVYENIGNETIPIFELTEDTLHNSSGGIIYCEKSTMGDLDGDGDKDLMCGEYGGFLDYYENIGDSLQYSFYLYESQFEGIDVGWSAAPIFCDIDDDEDLDLFIGEEYGNIWFYRNDGWPTVPFTYVTDEWLGIYVGEKAVPEFCDIDGDGDFDLFIGKDNDSAPTPMGDLHFWRNNGTPQNPQFEEERQMYLTFDIGDTPDPRFVDINLDSKMDLYL